MIYRIEWGWFRAVSLLVFSVDRRPYCKRAVKYRVAGFLAGTVWLEGGEHVGLPDLDDSASGSS